MVSQKISIVLIILIALFMSESTFARGGGGHGGGFGGGRGGGFGGGRGGGFGGGHGWHYGGSGHFGGFGHRGFGRFGYYSGSPFSGPLTITGLTIHTHLIMLHPH